MSWQDPGRDLARPEGGGTVTLASDADRDVAVRVLNEAFAEGRLTADEHAERIRETYAARTWQDLAWLTADLPDAAGSPDPPSAARQAAPAAPDGMDRCLLCALLIACPPAGIAWLLARRHRQGARQRHADADSGRTVLAAPGAARAGDAWRAQDR
jgi:Domain of unknown function (DUF1707)